MPRKQAPLSRSIVFVYCVTVKFAYRGNLHRTNIGLCKLLFSAKLEASLFDGILKGGFVNIIVTVPLHAEFLTRDIRFCGKNSVQAQSSLFDARFAVATTHTENTIRHNYRFLVFVVMTMAVTFAFMVLISIVGIVHFLRHSYNDKIRTRMLYEIFITIDICCMVFIVLQPQHYDCVLHIMIVNTAPLIGHFIALTRTRLTNIFFITLMIVVLLITAYNLWISSLIF
jgi:hypothetical protein